MIRTSLMAQQVESTCNVGDLGSIPGLGRSPGEGKGYPLQHSGLENSMDCIVHGVAKSRTGLSDFHSVLWYDCRTTRGSHSAKPSSNSLQSAWPQMNATRWREEKGSQVNQGTILNSDAGTLRGDWTHCRKRADRGLQVQVLDPRSWDETHTIPRPGTWGHMATVSKVMPPPQALPLGRHDPRIGHQLLLVGSLT